MSRYQTLAILMGAYALSFAVNAHAGGTCDVMDMNHANSGQCSDRAADADGDIEVMVEGNIRLEETGVTFRGADRELTSGRGWIADVKIKCEGTGCDPDDQMTKELTQIGPDHNDAFANLDAVVAWVKQKVQETKTSIQTRINQIEQCQLNEKTGQPISAGSSEQLGCFIDQLSKIKAVDRAQDYYNTNIMQRLYDLMGSEKVADQQMGEQMLKRLEASLDARKAAGLEDLAYVRDNVTFLKGIQTYRDDREKLVGERAGMGVGTAEYKAKTAQIRQLDLDAGKSYYDQGMKVGIDPLSAEATEQTVDTELAAETPDVSDDASKVDTKTAAPADTADEDTETGTGLIAGKKRGSAKASDSSVPATSKVTTQGTGGIPTKAMPAEKKDFSGSMPAIDTGVPQQEVDFLG